MNSSIYMTNKNKRVAGLKNLNYAEFYNSQDDPIPNSQILEILSPNTIWDDSTAMKGLVIAPSRIGDGLGVYTIVNIPADTITMDYVDETNEIITKDMVTNGTRVTTYMYANHKTSTYIDAINNKNLTVEWCMKQLGIEISIRR